MWKDLSMKEKAAMMKVAVKNDIYDIGEILDRYNKYDGESNPTGYVDINSKYINDMILALPSRNELTPLQRRQEDISAINDWAILNPSKVFENNFLKLRLYLTDDTWNTVMLNSNILDVADKRWGMIPERISNNYRSNIFNNSIRNTLNNVALKIAPIAIGAVAAPVIGPTAALHNKLAATTLGKVINTGLAADGVYNLFTDNGVLKTYRHLKEGEYGKAALSGMGDLLDASGIAGVSRVGMKGLKHVLPSIKKFGNKYKVDYDPFGLYLLNYDSLPWYKKALIRTHLFNQAQTDKLNKVKNNIKYKVNNGTEALNNKFNNLKDKIDSNPYTYEGANIGAGILGALPGAALSSATLAISSEKPKDNPGAAMASVALAELGAAGAILGGRSAYKLRKYHNNKYAKELFNYFKNNSDKLQEKYYLPSKKDLIPRISDSRSFLGRTRGERYFDNYVKSRFGKEFEKVKERLFLYNSNRPLGTFGRTSALELKNNIDKTSYSSSFNDFFSYLKYINSPENYLGYYSPSEDRIAINPLMFFRGEGKDVYPVFSHELLHRYLDLYDSPLDLYDINTDYFSPNPYNHMYDELKVLKGNNRRPWILSANEVDSELAYLREKLYRQKKIPYRTLKDYDIDDKKNILNYIENRFDLDNYSTYLMLQGLSTKGGYALGGPLFNSSSPIESFQGRKQVLPIVRYDEGGNMNKNNIIDIENKILVDSILPNDNTYTQIPLIIDTVQGLDIPELPKEVLEMKRETPIITVEEILEREKNANDFNIPGMIDWSKYDEGLSVRPTYTHKLFEDPDPKYKILDREQKLHFEDLVVQIQKQRQMNRFEELSKMTYEDRKKIQREMSDLGMYDLFLLGKTREEIIKQQEKLIRRGKLPATIDNNGNYVEADGIVGPKTLAAWREFNVDGIIGDRTKTVYKQKQAMGDTTEGEIWNRECPTKGVEGCALWVTLKSETALGETSYQNGIWGNAWQMPLHIIDSGGTSIYNVYDDKVFDNANIFTLLPKTYDALKRNPVDYSKMRVGDIVGIFLPSSKMHGTALEDGTTYNTHIGVVTKFDKDGMPIVEHNIHGKHVVDRANDLHGSTFGKAQIATITRSKATASPINEFKYDPKSVKSKYYVEKNGKIRGGELLQRYADSMASVSSTVGEIYKNADMEDVQKLCLAVLDRETKFMESRVSDQLVSEDSSERNKAKGRKLLGDIGRAALKKSDDSISSDLTKFKLNTLTKDEQRFAGIHSSLDLEIPEKAGFVAMLVMAKNYDYFKRLLENYPELGITDDHIRALTAISYNLGMSNLYHVGFDKETGEARPEELEQISKFMDPNYTEKADISGYNTKYPAHIDDYLAEVLGVDKNSKLWKAFVALSPIILGSKAAGKWWYNNKLAEIKRTYSGAAMYAFNNYIKTREDA